MIGLIRIRCEQNYGNNPGTRDWPASSHILVDSPPELAEQIGDWYEERGWEVIKEPI